MGFLQNLSPQQRLAVFGGGGVVLVLLVVGIVFAVMSGGKKDEPQAREQESGYEVVFRHLQPKEMDEAAAALKAQKIREFKFTEDGTLLVQKDKVVDARVALGEAQVPKNPNTQGLEIFNKKDFISTDFDKKIAFLRALNGELTRLVRKVQGVEDATVLVNMPEETLFQQEKKAVTASVMVKMEASRQLTAQQVEGIQHMVASAVPGLMTDNVTVVDDQGTLISSGLETNIGDQNERLVARAIDQQMKVTRAMEGELQTSLQLLLDKLVGNGKSVVRVRLELDFNKRQVRNRLLAPVTANGEPMSSARSVQRETTKNGVQGAAPGTTANLPSYPLLPGSPAGQPGVAGGGGSGQESSRENIREQPAFNQEDQIVQTASGNIKRMSIAVLLPETVKPEAVDKLRAVIAAAAGADPARRDQVTVERVKFDTTLMDQLKEQLNKKEAEAKAAAKKKGAVGWNLVIWGGVAAFIFAAIVALLSRRKRSSENPFDVLSSGLDADALPSGFEGPGALGGLPTPDQLGALPGGIPQGMPQMGGYDQEQADYGAQAAYGAPQQAYGGAQEAGGGETPFDFAYQVGPEQLADALSTERPATVAGVLAQLDASFAETVIASLPSDIQGDVFNRLSQGANLPSMTQRMVSQTLRRKLGVPV
ncbi:MAG: flagellar basal-body MS-ring/collar protein FliF [Candidatus Sericytochromatia bacterium]|nr:flagellar basal-body MS-ring/collar protein FliF [Candidatus Sericytochromatia bacterium]